MLYTGRNLEIVTLDSVRYLVTTTTSSIGTGSNAGDDTIVFPYLLGRLKARSLVADLMSIYADLTVLTVTIFLELIPQGEEILRGIKDELSTVYQTEIPILSHFHPYAKTEQTVLVLMATGVVYKDRIKIDSTKRKDYLYALGLPKLSEEIINLDSMDLAKLYCIKELAQATSIHEIIALNGQTIAQTIDYIEKTVGLQCSLEIDNEEMLSKIGQGASCLVFSSSHKVKSADYDGIVLTYLGRMN